MDEYDDGPYWAILLMYGSHDMRHTGFRRLTVVNETPGFWGVTAWYQSLGIRIPRTWWVMGLGHAVNVQEHHSLV